MGCDVVEEYCRYYSFLVLKVCSLEELHWYFFRWELLVHLFVSYSLASLEVYLHYLCLKKKLQILSFLIETC
jgi:hypothetical protein